MRFKRGPRKDLKGTKVRSQWEAEVLRWLKTQKIKWEYEPEVFYFESIKRGTKTYLPDVKLLNYPTKGEYSWLEIKGRWTTRTATQTRRFRIYYPEEFKKLLAIVYKPGCESDIFYAKMGVPIMAYYHDLELQRDSIPHWGE